MVGVWGGPHTIVTSVGGDVTVGVGLVTMVGGELTSVGGLVTVEEALFTVDETNHPIQAFPWESSLVSMTSSPPAPKDLVNPATMYPPSVICWTE